MKRADNRIVKFLVVVSFVFGAFLLTPNFGNKTHAHAGVNNPTEVAPCSLYGIHRMYAESTATVKYQETGNIAISLGTMYKCACGSTVVVEGRPPGSPIGKYATDPTPVIGTGGYVSYVTPKNNVRSTSSYSIPGYRFY